MKRWRALVVVLCAVVLSYSPPLWSWSGASGAHSVIALFQSHVHPDIPFDEFAAGRLGIIQPTWRRSYLYVAYGYMAGSGFDAGEQKALVSMWNEALGVQLPSMVSQWVSAGNGVDNRTAIKLGEASAAWIAARNGIPGVEKIDTIDVYRSASNGAIFSYANCYDSALQTAAQTLYTMIGKFALGSSQVKQWVDAQDQVFNNCSNPSFDPDAWSKAVDEWDQARNQVPSVSSMPSFSGNCKSEKFLTAARELNVMIGKLGASNPQVGQWINAQDHALAECSSQQAPPPPSGPDIPQTLNDGTPFERAQRMYQIACANFYSGNFDTAAKMFDEIAADPASPWQQLAPYLVARATIRKATLSSEKNDHALLAQAEAQLNEIIARSGDDGVKHYAQQLLGFVDAQLHPQEREEELARAVMLPTSGEVLEQNVSDYIWMLNYDSTNNNVYSDDLSDWIFTTSALGQGNGDATLLTHSIEKWKSVTSLPWLVTAISGIAPSDPNVPALLKAAEKVTPNAPAFVTVTYHIARLLIGQGKTVQARKKLDAMLANREGLPHSTVNQIEALRMGIARNLDEMLVDAPRTPLGITDTPIVTSFPRNSTIRVSRSWPPGRYSIRTEPAL